MNVILLFLYSVCIERASNEGGSLDGWGGPGYDNCEALLGTEFSKLGLDHPLVKHADILTLIHQCLLQG